jgi:hypothetical protein
LAADQPQTHRQTPTQHRKGPLRQAHRPRPRHAARTAAGNAASIAISIALAFFFGYALTLGPVLRAGVPLRRALSLTFASDTVSIATIELVDNAFILLVPGAMAAGLADGLFWWSLAVSLVVAFVLTVPVNRMLIARGRGHAVVHQLCAQ